MGQGTVSTCCVTAGPFLLPSQPLDSVVLTVALGS